jgi:hypothetical protein
MLKSEDIKAVSETGRDESGRRARLIELLKAPCVKLMTVAPSMGIGHELDPGSVQAYASNCGYRSDVSIGRKSFPIGPRGNR